MLFDAEIAHFGGMGTAIALESLVESRSFETRHGSRVAIVGGGVLGSTLALRYRQAGRIVSLFESTERLERRGLATIASTDRSLLALLDELGLLPEVRWMAGRSLGPRFGYLPGGRSRIVETLRDRARAIDVDVRLGTAVRSIDSQRAGFEVVAGEGSGNFDQVVLAVPSPLAAELGVALPAHERDELTAVNYMGIVTVSFVLERRFGRAYIARVARGNDAFTVHDLGALTPVDDRSDKLVYVTRPLAAHDELWGANDRTVIEHFARALPGNVHISSARVLRSRHAFTQRRLEMVGSSIPGLSIVNAAHFAAGRHHLERTAALATSAFRHLCAERLT